MCAISDGFIEVFLVPPNTCSPYQAQKKNFFVQLQSESPEIVQGLQNTIKHLYLQSLFVLEEGSGFFYIKNPLSSVVLARQVPSALTFFFVLILRSIRDKLLIFFVFCEALLFQSVTVLWQIVERLPGFITLRKCEWFQCLHGCDMLILTVSSV